MGSFPETYNNPECFLDGFLSWLSELQLLLPKPITKLFSKFKSKREPKDTIFAALLGRPESVIPWFHERFVARCPIGQIWDRWWVYKVLLFGKTANIQSNGSWVVDCSITNLKGKNFLLLHRTNVTVSVPLCNFLMLKRRLNHKYSKRYKEKLLSEAFKRV